MTLEDFINGVRYEIQGNVEIKIETEHDEVKAVYENHNGTGIIDSEIEEYLNRIINYVYTDNYCGEPVLVIELGDEDEC